MLFFSELFNKFALNVKKLERDAEDEFPISNELKAIRLKGKVYVIDEAKNKVIDTLTDTFPNNPARAVLAIQKKLKLEPEVEPEKTEKKATWTCGFRENEDRWVWYENNQPKMTVSFKEAYPSQPEYRKEFINAKYGTAVIQDIRKIGLYKSAQKINAVVLENSFVKIQCKKCNHAGSYTIDDLVDDKRQAKYDSNLVVCANCNELVEL